MELVGARSFQRAGEAAQDRYRPGPGSELPALPKVRESAGLRPNGDSVLRLPQLFSPLSGDLSVRMTYPGNKGARDVDTSGLSRLERQAWRRSPRRTLLGP